MFAARFAWLLVTVLLQAAVCAQAADLPEGPGKAEVVRVCTQCHGIAVVTGAKRTREEWQDVVNNMIRRGANASTRETSGIVQYLTLHFGANERITVMPAMPPAPRLVISKAGLREQAPGQTDWEFFGHDPGATRYSPLHQINTGNVEKLLPVWKFNTGERGSQFEVSPLVVNNVMYVMTPSQHIVALEPETGRELWSFDAHAVKGSVGRGVAFWPGDGTRKPRIIFGTDKAQLVALDAKTGQPAKEFGNSGVVDFDPATMSRYPHARYAITSPPAIYKNLVITGPELPEGPSHGPPGDVRAFDARTGKLVWCFDPLQRLDSTGKPTWGPEGWKDRTGPSVWGFYTVDAQTGSIFIPIGNPADSFYGADRPGKNLYANSVVALDAATGKVRWFYQMVHHDTSDYDVAAPPTLITVVRNGRAIPAIAEITKMGLLFILDRRTGAPAFGVAERAVPQSDVPGEKSWPTQPFPLKPPPLARNSMTAADISHLSSESKKFCTELLRKYPNKGPYTPFLLNGSSVFPSTMGGGNWGGVAFDPYLHRIFVNTSSIGSIGRMMKAPAGSAKDGEGGMPYRNEGGYQRFVDQDHYPCNRPPWGELTAVNADTGDIEWRVPLGSYDELERRGIRNTGAPGIGGPIVTAGQLVFIGATNDSHFHAVDSRTGRELWTAKLDASGEATPITYLGRDGKQYVVIASGTTGHFRSVGPDSDDLDVLTAFALP